MFGGMLAPIQIRRSGDAFRAACADDDDSRLGCPPIVRVLVLRVAWGCQVNSDNRGGNVSYAM